MRGFCLEVEGAFACFTRPEMKVERVSYDFITPSAARAIFSSILWKPAIRWHVKKIAVLNPIRWISIRRNEVDAVASSRSEGIFIEDARAQRAGLLLRDVKYRITAEFEFIPPEKRGKVANPVPEWLVETYDDEEKQVQRTDETEAKYAAMFERRAKKGQTFTHPYLGCREFSCAFKLVSQEEVVECPGELRGTRTFGWMLYDMDYRDPANITPMFYHPEMNDGVVMVPPWNSEEVRQ